MSSEVLQPVNGSSPPPTPSSSQRRGRWTLFFIWLVTTVPIVVAAVMYFYVRPEARSNYGQLIEPQRPVPALTLTTLDGKPFDWSQLQKKWVLVHADAGACDAHCVNKLYYMRQVRLSMGKDIVRLERVWLITDEEPVSTQLIREHDGALFLRAKADQLRTFFPLAQTDRLSDSIWVVDPMAHLMMRFPKDFEPAKLRKDVSKLLYASRGWNTQ